MATWIEPSDPVFNVLTDGKPVNAKTANYAINNIAGNLQYLYDRVTTLTEDASAVIDYSAPVDPGIGSGVLSDVTLKVGMPVYWKISDNGSTGYWSPAYISLLDTSGEDESGDKIYHWQYDSQSFASGIILRVLNSEGTLVDVALGGTVDFTVGSSGEFSAIKNIVTGYPDWATNFDNPLQDLFFNDTNDKLDDIGDRTQSSYLDEDDLNDPTMIRHGVYFLSDKIGKISPANQYTRVMGIVTLHATPAEDGATYTMNFVVCPEGFGGEKFHVHQKVVLEDGLPSGYTLVPAAFPDSWMPNLDDLGAKTSINIAIGEIATTEIIYPYSELLDGVTPVGALDPYSDTVKVLYTGTTVGSGGWLSANEAYFTDFTGITIPTGAIWGYAIQGISRFSSTAEEKAAGIFWKAPALYEHMVLLQDGVPVPSSYYTIDASGIWWLQDGCEKSPIKHLLTNTTGSLSLWYIAEFGDTENSAVSSVNSTSLAVTNSGGAVTVDDQSKFIEFLLTPVLPFNPVDDLILASESDVESSAASNRLMSVDLVKHATATFTALTNETPLRGCTTHTGTWNDLTISGFWMVKDMTNKPPDLNMTSDQYVFGLVGRSSAEENGLSGTDYCYQMLIDPASGHGMYIRLGSYDSVWSWNPWHKFSNRVSQVTLPGRVGTTAEINYLSDTILSFDIHESRYLVSQNETVDVVRVPSLSESMSGTLWHTKEMTFVNRMSPGTLKSGLVIHLEDPIPGLYDATYLISLGEACTEARHHMGMISYATGSAVPPYLTYDIEYTGSPATEVTETLRVNCDSLAPQFYGDSTIRLAVIDTAWCVVGGTGVWFALTQNQYEAWSRGDIVNTTGTGPTNHPACSLSTLLGEPEFYERAIRFSSMKIPKANTVVSFATFTGSTKAL